MQSSKAELLTAKSDEELIVLAISFLFQQTACLSEQLGFRIGDDHRTAALHDVWQGKASGFSCTCLLYTSHFLHCSPRSFGAPTLCIRCRSYTLAGTASACPYPVGWCIRLLLGNPHNIEFPPVWSFCIKALRYIKILGLDLYKSFTEFK